MLSFLATFILKLSELGCDFLFSFMKSFGKLENTIHDFKRKKQKQNLKAFERVKTGKRIVSSCALHQPAVNGNGRFGGPSFAFYCSQDFEHKCRGLFCSG